jgi:hypothetical protein
MGTSLCWNHGGIQNMEYNKWLIHWANIILVKTRIYIFILTQKEAVGVHKVCKLKLTYIQVAGVLWGKVFIRTTKHFYSLKLWNIFLHKLYKPSNYIYKSLSHKSLGRLGLFWGMIRRGIAGGRIAIWVIKPFVALDCRCIRFAWAE